MSRRRVLLVLVGLSAGALGSRLARAAEPAQKVARVGVVSPFSSSSDPAKPFRERLHELGYVEGQNLIIEARWADGRYDRLPALMAEVIERRVDVLVTWTTQAAIAAKNATSSVPIVFASVNDPIRSGLAASLARPGGNLTGLSVGFAEGFAGKWLQLLQETVPRLSHVAVIENPDTPSARDLARDIEAIAPTRGLKFRLIEVREPAALDRAFEEAARKSQAVLLLPDPMLAANREKIIALAAKHRLPAIYFASGFVESGGLMAYAPDFLAMWRRAAEYVDKILKGAKPADLPIEQPTQYTLVLNLKTAKALGLTIPQSILLQADEVIR